MKMKTKMKLSVSSLGLALMLCTGPALATAIGGAAVPARPASSAPAKSEVKPSSSAVGLKILGGEGETCYSVEASANNAQAPELQRAAETMLGARLEAMNLAAVAYDEDAECAREVVFSFQVDTDGEPTIYIDNLRLISYSAFDEASKVEMPSAVAWRNTFWGGQVAIMSEAEYTDKMLEHLGQELDQFEVDWKSLR